MTIATLVSILIPLLFVAVLVHRLVRRGLELRQLVRDGVEVSAVVVRKVAFNASGPRQRYLRYQYRDELGRVHSHRSLMDADEWASHADGGPIDVVYSRSKPHISAPRGLVEQCRTALAARNSAGR